MTEYSTSKDKYENSGIFSYAGYLLMDVNRVQIPVPVTSTPTSETTATSSMIEKIPGHWLYVVNHSHQTITIHNATCSKGKSGYQILWEDQNVSPNGVSLRAKPDQMYCPSVIFEIVLQEGNSFPIQLVFDPNYTYRITITDSDFR